MERLGVELRGQGRHVEVMEWLRAEGCGGC